MVWACRRNDAVLRRFSRDRLQELLQFALRIFENRQGGKLTKRSMKLAQDEISRRLKSSIQKNCPEQRLKSIRQPGKPLSASMELLAPAQNQMCSQTKLPCVLGQRPAIHQLGPAFCQRSFSKSWELFIQLAGQYELQDGVSQEFQALVGLDWQALLMGNRGVRQRQLQ